MEGIVFESITLEGFGSFHNETTFTLDRKGITLIVGENGEGKTTLFSALAWALYKINLKGTVNDKVVTWADVRTKDFRGTRVIVEFTKGVNTYTVARHLKFKGETLGVIGNDELLLATNGQLGDAQHKKDTQEEIEAILGIDSQIFLNSTIFGQRMKRLIEADAKDKRELLENLFSMEFINAAKDQATAKEAELTKEIFAHKTTILLDKGKIESLESEYAKGKELLDTFETNKATKLAALEDDLTRGNKALLDNISIEKALNEKLAVASKAIDLPPNWKAEKSKLEDDIAAASLAVREANKTVSDYTSSVSQSVAKVTKLKTSLAEIKDTCPTCNVPFSDTHSIDEAKNELKSQIALEEKAQKVLTTQLTELTTKYNELVANKVALTEQLGQYVTMQEKEDKFKLDNTTLLGEIADIIKKRNVIEVAITALTARKTELTNTEKPNIDLVKINNAIVDLQDKIDAEELQVTTKTEKMNQYIWWKTKAFGASGIKTYIFNAMLEKLNVYAEKYTSRLGLAVKFEIDMSKASRPFLTRCFVGGIEADYNELSGGQKQRIDICMSFALHDLIAHKTDINLLVLDEVFENLDRRGVEAVFDLIGVKASTGKAIFVITHQTLIDASMSKSFTVYHDSNKHSNIE